MPVYQITATTCGVSTTYRVNAKYDHEVIPAWRKEHPFAQATQLSWPVLIDPETLLPIKERNMVT